MSEQPQTSPEFSSENIGDLVQQALTLSTLGAVGTLDNKPGSMLTRHYAFRQGEAFYTVFVNEGQTDPITCVIRVQNPEGQTSLTLNISPDGSNLTLESSGNLAVIDLSTSKINDHPHVATVMEGLLPVLNQEVSRLYANCVLTAEGTRAALMMPTAQA